jgi:hypothetical protein
MAEPGGKRKFAGDAIFQLSLVFRLGLSEWINREHEVMNTAVILGGTGSLLVSIPANMLTRWLDLSRALADLLGYRLAPG